MFTIYWLISENRQNTYIGYNNDIIKRVREHRNKNVTTTKNFGKFRCFRLEEVDDIIIARRQEKYWKSAVGRRKLKRLFSKIV